MTATQVGVKPERAEARDHVKKWYRGGRTR
jgi:hypothetical protein